MLRLVETETRDVRSLDGLWDFAIEDGPFAREVAVPASVNDLFTDEKIRDHVGVWRYRRTVRVPRGWADQDIFLRFGSVTHEARVLIDGRECATFKGGYMPFEVSLTDLVEPGATFELVVEVDNRLDNTSIPPGEVVELPDGRLRQDYKHDFFNYSGIHRSVYLGSRPKRHVTDVVVTTSYAGTTGTVTWDVQQSEAGDVEVAVIDKRNGAVVVHGTGAQGSAEIPDVNLWTPGVGGMYDLVVTLVDADVFVQPFGVRTVTVADGQFLINGEPFYFTGFGMHEDHETIGKAHSHAHMIQDLDLLSWIGANSLRTSHYPYSEEFMDYCDRQGIVVIDETAAVGLNWMMVGGIIDSGNGETYEPGHVDDGTQAQHALEIERLIKRDRNHPSVVLWSIANEPDTATEKARDYFAPLAQLARDLDPTRPVGYVNVMFAPYDSCTISDLFDVLMLNRYYGWYTHTGDLASAEAAWSTELQGWVDKYPNKPIIITEYGADTVAGTHSVYDQPFTEDYQVAYLEMNSRVFDSQPHVVGEQMWNFADFQTKYGYARVDGNKKGAFTRDRRPKAAARWLRNRWHNR